MTESSSHQQASTDNKSTRVVVHGSFELHPQSPLPHLDSPGVKAYAATDMRGGNRAVFALICRRDLRPRIDTVPALRRMPNMLMMKPIDAAVVFWPPESGRRLAMVFDIPAGKRVMPEADVPIKPWREEEIITRLLQPMAPVLRDLAERNICHRSIRADNIFYNDANESQILLGECVSNPPALYQSVIYETVANGMAMPEGRGNGRPADDIYALGVLIVTLLGGLTPCADMSDEDIIRSKIKKGSYGTLAGDLRPSLPMVEVLRGLLCDDPAERWKSNDIFMWLSGRHLSPKQAAFPPKAARPLVFYGKEYLTAPSLSYDMGLNWTAAIELIESGQLESWVRRSLGNEELAEQLRMTTMSAAAYGSPEQLNDRLLSRVLMILDPEAPLRYKNISARVEGLPLLLGIKFQDEGFRANYIEIIENKLPNHYMEAQLKVRPDYLSLRKLFESVILFLSKDSHGFGVERMLYEFCPGWPCQSPLLVQEYTADFEDLIQSLERLAQGDVSDKVPIDRHISAFCATAHPELVSREVSALNHADSPASHVLAMLRLLAEVQEIASAPNAPNLSGWFRQLLSPVVETFHNRETRELVNRRLDALVEGGNLSLLVANVDNIQERLQDTTGFAAARTAFGNLAREVAWLMGGGMTNQKYVRRSAQQSASVVSSILAGTALVILTAYYAF